MEIKKILSLALCLCVAMMALPFALGEEVEPASDLHRLMLGTSRFYVMVDEDFVPGELTEEDIADDQVGYYSCGETGLDFDVYQFSKDDVAPQLDHYTIDEAGEYDDVQVIFPRDVVNGIDVGWYVTTEAWDDEEYETITYIMDTGDEYVEIVFWIEDDDDRAECWEIIGSLSEIETQTIMLGISPFVVTAPADYQQGGLTMEDVEDDQVNYFYSDLSLMDFDVYQFGKDDIPSDLAEYVAEEAAEYAYVIELVTDDQINGIPVAWYRTVEEFEEGEYETITYCLDAGDEFVEVVFWMDGFTTEAEAEAIISTLEDLRETVPEELLNETA